MQHTTPNSNPQVIKIVMYNALKKDKMVLDFDIQNALLFSANSIKNSLTKWI